MNHLFSTRKLLPQLFSAVVAIASGGLVNSQTILPPTAAPKQLPKLPLADLAFDRDAMIRDIDSITIAIKNVGTVSSHARYVDCNVSRKPKALRTSTNIGIFTFNIPAIAAGASYTNSWHPGNPNRNTTYFMECDLKGDANESNNKFSWERPDFAASVGAAQPALNSSVATTTVLAPDLTFDESGSVAAFMSNGEMVIKNVGGTASASGFVLCDHLTQGYLDGVAEQQRKNIPIVDLPTVQNTFASVAPGQSLRVKISQARQDVVWLQCFIADIPGEKNTSNNRFEWKKTSFVPRVVGGASPAQLYGQPDLAFDETAMVNGVTQTVRVIKNVGTVANTNGTVDCFSTTQRWLDEAALAKKEGRGIVSSSAPNPWPIPAIAPGQSYKFPSLGSMPDIVDFNCKITQVAGEKNTANNSFQWKKPQIATRLDELQPVQSFATLAPDLAFDTASIRRDNYFAENLTIKNGGRGASKPTKMLCDRRYKMQPGLQPSSWNGPQLTDIPAIAAGATWQQSPTGSVLAGMIGAYWKCTIDPYSTSGDANAANNSYEFRWGDAPR